MKNLFFKTSMLLLTLLIVYSCKVDTEDENMEYYPFTEMDTENLLFTVPEVGDVISYKNQLGDELSFMVSRSINGPTQSSTLVNFAFRAGEVPFKYDVQNIEMDFLGSPDPGKVFILAIGKTSTNSLKGVFKFVLWNAIDDNTSGLNEHIILNFDSEITQLTSNGVIYENIIEIQSGNKNSLGTYFGIEKNINIIYYDKNYGVIGFDDTFGNEWRIKEN